MLYCIIEGREPGLIWPVESNSTEPLEKNLYGGEKFVLREEKFSKEFDQMVEKMAEKMIEIDAEKICYALLILEAFDEMPPVKTDMAKCMEKLIRSMAGNPNTTQKILKRAIQKWDFLDMEENSDYRRKS